jgi:hypothetical protein
MADRRDTWGQVASDDTSDVWAVEINVTLALAMFKTLGKGIR